METESCNFAKDICKCRIEKIIGAKKFNCVIKIFENKKGLNAIIFKQILQKVFRQVKI